MVSKNSFGLTNRIYRARGDRKINNQYEIQRGDSSLDTQELKTFFNTVFHPEDVGTLAETFFNHLPDMEPRHWFLIRDKATGALAASFACIPWTWVMEGIPIKVAEQGIVGTSEEHRNQGLMRILNAELDKAVKEDGFHMAAIQGIPGFYHNFDYYYSIPMDNHIEVPLHILPEEQDDADWVFTKATKEDIPFLVEEDSKYRDYYSISVFRDTPTWKYLLTESLKTEYGSEYWIVENKANKAKSYCRIPGHGWGKGLILSEISVDISPETFLALLIFCKQKALASQKPYIRLNIHNECAAGAMAITMGAKKGNPYAWQIKIADKRGFLEHSTPALEKRRKQCNCKCFTGVLRLEMFSESLDLDWQQGRLVEVRPGSSEECLQTFCLNQDMFPALALGHRTWQELQQNRPDIYPSSQHIRPHDFLARDQSATLVDALFPATKSWVYERY